MCWMYTSHFFASIYKAIFSFKGKVASEGKVEHKFDMKPHHENIEEYRRICRERTNKSMVKSRQIQVQELFHFQFLPLFSFGQIHAKLFSPLLIWYASGNQ